MQRHNGKKKTKRDGYRKYRRWNTNKTPVDETLVDETLAYMRVFVLQGDQI
jgi:hypothetical protein